MFRGVNGVVAGLMLGLLCVGCDGPQGGFKTAKQLEEEKKAAGHTGHDDHDHGAGPHGGAIVELGNEEYHAEIVVDGKTHALTVYLLGKDAKTAAPVAAAQATVVTEDNVSLTLKAAAQEGDGEGKASKFELVDEKSVGDIAKAGYLHGALQIEIDGKSYRGDIDAHFDGSSHDDHKEEHKDEHKDEPAKAEPEAKEEKKE